MLLSNIDRIKINFDQDNLIILNILLAFLMFSVSLGVSFKDFKRVTKMPKLIVVGLTSQWLLLPIMTLMLIAIIKPEASIVWGMIMIAVCPGGNVSNYATSLAKGNAALSITMTSIVTIFASFMTPFSFMFWAKFTGVEAIGDVTMYIDPIEMLKVVSILILLPLILGMSMAHYFPDFTKKVKKTIARIALLIFVVFIVGAIFKNIQNIKEYVSKIFIIVLIHNVLSMLVGYYFARLNKLSIIDSRTISIETGIQNTALGLILIFKFFDGLGGMALMAAWYGIWDMIVVLVVAFYWRKRVNS